MSGVDLEKGGGLSGYGKAVVQGARITCAKAQRHQVGWYFADEEEFTMATRFWIREDAGRFHGEGPLVRESRQRTELRQL